MENILQIKHLSKAFGSNVVLRDIDFSVEKGERNGRTYTRVVMMDKEQRKAELARITGGTQVTEALLRSAGELLAQAEAYRAGLQG